MVKKLTSLFSMTNNSTASATFEKRLPAFIIDMIPACFAQALLMLPFIMLPLMQKQIQVDQVLSRNLLVTAFAMMFIIFRDVFGGRSLGKRIMKLRVVSAAEKHPTPSFGNLVLRNIFVIIWPIEALLLLSGNVRLGDRVARTAVVDLKSSA